MSLRTPLCDLLSIDVPVLQAGMGKAKGSPTTPELVAAVSEAGGLGCIGAVGLEPEELFEWIKIVRTLTSKPFAVDFLVPPSPTGTEPTREEIRIAIKRDHPEHWTFLSELLSRYGLEPASLDRKGVFGNDLAQKQVEIALDGEVPVLVLGLGDATSFVKSAHGRGALVMALAGNPRHAKLHADAGVDVVIAQGYEAGGHTGTIATFALLPAVVDLVSPCPVIAAGGIADGRGMAAGLALGAQGVWCGTAFLFAEEANLAPEQRTQLINANTSDLVVSTCYTGKTARIVKTSLIEDWKQSGLSTLPMPHQHVLMDDFTLAAQQAGRWELVNNPAGQIAGILNKIRPAKDIVRDMVDEAEEVINRLAKFEVSK
jgi:nitronate monooxygenase